jgi:hypothetical protein
MSRTCHKFYSNLCSAHIETTADRLVQESINRLIPQKFTLEMNLKLTAPIGLKELEQAMKEMANEKAPGPDGVIIEFFKVFWTLVDSDYHRMICHSLISGILPTSVLRRLIILLHKRGDHLSLGNYRPITLLNSTYKIYAKCLQCRLQPVLA